MSTDSATDPADEAALAGTDLAELDGLPVAEHPAAYSRVHDRLQSALASLDHL